MSESTIVRVTLNPSSTLALQTVPIGPRGPQGEPGNLAQIADEVAAAIEALIDSAPGTLNTLNELAAALGDDPNFITTMNTSLSLKADDDSVVHLTGDESIAGAKTFSDARGQFRTGAPGNTFASASLNSWFGYEQDATYPLARLIAATAAQIPLLVKGAASQTANLQEWQNSSGAVKAAMDFAGRLALGTATPATDRLLTLGAGALHPSTATTIYGLFSSYSAPATATVAAIGVNSLIRTDAAAFTLADGYALKASSPIVGAGSAITTQSGLRVDNQGAAGIANAYGIVVGAQSGASSVNVAVRLDGGTLVNLWLNSDTISSAGGIAFGTARDATIIRAGSSQVHVGTRLSVSSFLTVGNGGNGVATDGIIVAGNLASHSSTATTISGVVANFVAPSTATSVAQAFYGQIRTAAAAFTLVDARGMIIDTPVVGAGSAITTARGLVINSQAAAGVGTSYGLVVASGSSFAARFDGGTGANLWLNSDTASEAGGIAFGTARDVFIYRGAANTLRLQGTANIDNSGRMGIHSSVVSDRLLSIANSNNHPSTATTVYGVVANYTAPATATTAANGIYAQVRTIASAFTMANGKALLIDGPVLGAGSAITTQEGVFIQNQGASGITNAYGIHVVAVSGASGTNVAARFDGGTQANLWLNSDTGSVAGGIAFGTARDVVLYRRVADVLKTDDNLEVAGTSSSFGGATGTARLEVHPGTSYTGQASIQQNGFRVRTQTSNFVTTAQTGDFTVVELSNSTITSTPAGTVIPDLSTLRVIGSVTSGANATATRSSAILVITGSNNNVGLAVRANSPSQSANLQDWQDSTAASLFSVTAAGLPKWSAAANVQTTVGAAGGASALPATPSKYLKVVGDDGVTYVVPAYAAA